MHASTAIIGEEVAELLAPLDDFGKRTPDLPGGMAAQHGSMSTLTRRLSGKRRFSMSCFYPCHGSIVLIRTRESSLPYSLNQKCVNRHTI